MGKDAGGGGEAVQLRRIRERGQDAGAEERRTGRREAVPGEQDGVYGRRAFCGERNGRAGEADGQRGGRKTGPGQERDGRARKPGEV